MTKALSVLLVSNKVKLLNHYALSYPKLVDTTSTLKTVGKTCLFLLKIIKCGKNAKKNLEWNKNKLSIKLHSKPIYDQKYLKAKVRELDGVMKTNFLGNGMPKENMDYTCTACITFDSIMRMDKKTIHRFIKNTNVE